MRIRTILGKGYEEIEAIGTLALLKRADWKRICLASAARRRRASMICRSAIYFRCPD